MSHLTIETLARLLDEAPDSNEAEHLAACEECSREYEGLRADAAALAALPAIEPPAAQWFAVEQQLVAEGLLRRSTRRGIAQWRGPWLQLAAALAIFVLGNYTAPLLRGRTGEAPSQTVAQTPAAASAPELEIVRPGRAGQVANLTEPAARTPAVPDDAVTAALAVREAEQLYLSALTRYSELAGRTAASDPLARLAALESIVLTTRAALGQAPADPVINGYHLTALAQRDATIKELATVADKTWF